MDYKFNLFCFVCEIIRHLNDDMLNLSDKLMVAVMESFSSLFSSIQSCESSRPSMKKSCARHLVRCFQKKTQTKRKSSNQIVAISSSTAPEPTTATLLFCSEDKLKKVVGHLVRTDDRSRPIHGRCLDVLVQLMVTNGMTGCLDELQVLFCA